ncbi:MAG: hypothetical protein C0179_05100 [Fervidicoccus sp.]|nr:MAG: hypothetical protein C0179_05100 [Fervidicoccus sp.]
MFRRYFGEVAIFLIRKDCEALKMLVRSIGAPANRLSEAGIMVVYSIIEEDCPEDLRNLIPSFNEFVELVDKCLGIERRYPELELNEELYREVSEKVRRIIGRMLMKIAGY